jgi:acyl-CoA synthetase (AMP-forming)/AMP-acid ligase II
MNHQTTAGAFSTLSALLAYWAVQTPGADAAIEAGRRLSYAQLEADVTAKARALIGAGVGHGDRVAMLAPPGVEFWIHFLAAAEIGAIWIGLNPRHTDLELSEVVARVTPRLLIVPETLDGRSYEAWRSQQGHDVRVIVNLHEARRSLVGPNDPCLIVFTSGSTGSPKAVVMRQGALVGASLIQASLWKATPLRVLNNLPVNHIGCVGDLGVYTLAGGGALVFAPRFDPAQTVALIEAQAITVWGQVPTMFQMTLDAPGFEPKRLSTLQRIFWGGAQASPDLLAGLEALGVPLSTSYGQTETVGSIAFTPDGASLDLLTQSVGRAGAPYEVRIAGGAEEGEIEVRTPFGMSGYWTNQGVEPVDMSAEWRGTGDVGAILPEGDIVLRGRVHDVFKSGGYNIYPGEIETALEAHSSVAQAAVVGVEDRLFGQAGWAFLLAAGKEPTEEELRAHLTARIANYKIPKRFIFVDALALLPVGKVDKTQLREVARGLS